MGTVARSGLIGLVIGNTNEINCSVLAVMPDRFVSPITEGEYIDFAREAEHAC